MVIKRVENVTNKFTVTKIRAITLAAGTGWNPTTTASKSVSDTCTIPPATKARHFALFPGWHSVAGRWHYLSCSRAARHGVEKFGPAKSYGAYDDGTVLCARSLYKSSDYRYQAAVAAGCRVLLPT